MRAFGYLSLMAVFTIMVMVVTGSPAFANPAKGYRVTYLANRGHYCIRPVTQTEAERLGIPVHTTECHSASVWAFMGIKVSRA